MNGGAGPVNLDDSDEYYRRIVEKVRLAEKKFGQETKQD